MTAPIYVPVNGVLTPVDAKNPLPTSCPRAIITGPVRATGDITNNNLLTTDGSPLDVTGYRSVTVYLPPSAGGVVELQQSFNGAVWYSMNYTIASQNATNSALVTYGGRTLSANGEVVHAALDMPLFRVRGLYNSTDRVTQFLAVLSTLPFASASIIASLPASDTRIGRVSGTMNRYTDSATAITTGGGSFTGIARNAFSGAPVQWAESFSISAFAASDVAGVLWLAVSLDGSTNWRRIERWDTVQQTGGVHRAQASHVPNVEFYRWEYDNGPAAQTWFILRSTARGI
jgi:hypothetical protein